MAQGVFKAPILALFVFVAVASANYGWTPGQEYTYQVRQHLVAGQPELKHQYAGKQLKFKVTVQVPQPDTLLIKAHDLDQAEINEVITGEFWNARFPNQQSFHGQVKSQLERPFVAQISNGKVRSIKTDQSEPEYVTNFMKSIGSALSVDNNGLGQAAHQQSQHQKDQVSNIYKTFESTVSGEFQVIYEKHQVPSAIRRENIDEVAPVPELCQGSPVWEVTKTFNFTNQNDNIAPVFNTITPNGHNAHNGWKQLVEHVQSTRYTLCGGQRGGLIQTIYGDEEFIVQPLGYKTEKLIAYSKVTFVLRHVQSIRAHLQVPSAGKHTSNIVFKFPAKHILGGFQGQQYGQDEEYGRQSYGRQFYGQQYDNEYNQQYGQDEEYSRQYGQQYDNEYNQQYDQEYNQDYNNEYNQQYGQDGEYSYGSYAPYGVSRRQSSVGSWFRTVFGGRQQYDDESAYNQQYQPEQKKKSTIHPQQRYPHPTLTRPVAAINPKHISTAQLEHHAEQLTQEIAHDLHRPGQQQQSRVSVLDKISTLSKKLEYLTLQQLKQVYQRVAHQGAHSVEQKQTQKQIFLDTLAISGTNPSVILIKELIEKHELKGEQAAQIVMTLPKYVKTPTKELVSELFDLLRSQAVQSQQQLRTTLKLATTKLINYAFVRPSTKNNKYPTHIFGTFGNPDSAEVTQKYIPYLVQKLEQTKSTFEQSVIVKSLGNIAHKAIYPVLKKVVKGEIETSDYVRSQAAQALRSLIESGSLYKIRAQQGSQEAKHFVKAVKQTLLATTLNPSVNYRVRLSAFNALVDSNIDLVYLQKIALRTWWDPSQQWVSYVLSTLKSLAKLDASLQIPKIHQVIENAKRVLPLARPFNSGLLYAFNHISSNEIEDIQLGFISQLISFGSKKSVIPEKIRFNSVYQAGAGFNFLPLSLALNAYNVKDFTQKLFGERPFLELNKNENQQYHHLLHQIKEQLNVESRKNQQPLDGSFYVRIADEIQRMFPVNHQTIQHIISKYAGEHQQLAQGVPINYQKALKLADITLAIPSQTGVAFVLKIKVPAVVSLKGHLKVQTETQSGLFPSKVKVVADLSPLYTWKIIASAGFHSYKTQKTYATGFEKELKFHLPGAIVIKADLKHKEVSVKHVLPEQQQVAHPSQLEVFTYKVKPFTVIAKTNKVQAITLAEDKKTIKTVQQLNQKTKQFGQRTAGLSFTLEQQSETDLEDSHDLIKKVWQQGLQTLVQFPTASSTLRYRKYRLTLDLAQSQTKETIFAINYDEAFKAALVKHTPVSGSGYQKQYDNTEEYETEYRSGKPFFAAQGQFQDQEYQQFQGQQYQGEHYQGQTFHGQTRYGHQSPSTANQANKSIRRHLISKVFNEVESGKVSTLDFAVIFQGATRRQYSATFAVGSDASKTTKKVKAVFEASPATTGGHQSHKVYVSLTAKFPSVPEVGLEQVLNADLSAFVKAKINFGQSIEQPHGQIKIEGVLKQTPEVNEFVNTLHKTKQCKKISQEGFKLHPTCVNATRLAATLNEYHFQVQYHNVPQSIQQTLVKVENLAKAVYYPQLTDRKVGVHHEHNKVSVAIKVHPIRKTFDVKIEKPTETLIFNKVKLSNKIETILPINAKRSIAQRTWAKFLGGVQSTRCSIGQEKVVTFDNVIYDAPLNNNYHVLTKDCSGRYKFAVLVKEQSQGQKSVKVIGQNTEVKIPAHQAGQQAHSGSIQITINKQQQTIPVNQLTKVVEHGKTVLTIVPRPNGFVVIKAPVHGFEVRTNGRYVITKVSPVHRSNLCGLCGDFNGEQTADLKTPQKCIESPEHPQRFVRSYAIQDGSSPRGIQYEGFTNEHQQQTTISRLASYFTPYIWGESAQKRSAHHQQQDGRCVRAEEYYHQKQQQHLIGSGTHDYARFEQYADDEFSSDLYNQIEASRQSYGYGDESYGYGEQSYGYGEQSYGYGQQSVHELKQRLHQAERRFRQQGGSPQQQQLIEEAEQLIHQLKREQQQGQRPEEQREQLSEVAQLLNKIHRQQSQAGFGGEYEQVFEGQGEEYHQLKQELRQLEKQHQYQSGQEAEYTQEKIEQVRRQLRQLNNQGAEYDSDYASSDEQDQYYGRRHYQQQGSEYEQTYGQQAQEVREEVREVAQELKEWAREQRQEQAHGQSRQEAQQQYEQLEQLKEQLKQLQYQPKSQEQQEKVQELKQKVKQWERRLESQVGVYNKYRSHIDDSYDQGYESQYADETEQQQGSFHHQGRQAWAQDSTEGQDDEYTFGRQSYGPYRYAHQYNQFGEDSDEVQGQAFYAQGSQYNKYSQGWGQDQEFQGQNQFYGQDSSAEYQQGEYQQNDSEEQSSPRFSFLSQGARPYVFGRY